MIYVINILFIFFMIMYSKYQFADEKSGWSFAKSKWHIWGALMRILFIIIFVLPLYFHIQYNIWDVVLCGVIDIILFDFGINKIAMNEPLFYIGNTSKSDKLAKKIKWYLYAIMLIAAIIFKFKLFKL